MSSQVYSLLSEASHSQHPREQIRLIRLAIAKAKVKYPEIVQELEELDKKLHALQSGVNWEAFTAYAAAGRWEFIDDDRDFFNFARLLSEIDQIAATVLKLVEEVQKKRKNEILSLLRGG